MEMMYIIPLWRSLASSSWFDCARCRKQEHSSHFLRLPNTNFLFTPFVCTSFGARSFIVAAPKTKIWNSPSSSSNVFQSWYFLPNSRPTVFSRPSNPLNVSLLAPHIRPYYNPTLVFSVHLQIIFNYLLTCMWWWLGVVVSVVGRINKVKQHWVQLVLGWVTVSRLSNHHSV